VAKGLSVASITPFGTAIKAGNAGIRLVRKSSIVKWISPKKVENVTGKGTDNAAHNAAQYQKLKEQLALDEIQSVINTTKHGAERLIERGFTPKDISDLKLRPDIIKTQSDGAQVFIKQVNGKYNVIVEGDNGVITSLKNISENSLNRLSDNYGWR
jgi:hypothetical protein